MQAVSLRHVDYHYPDGTPALIDVCLDIAAGERVAVLGPNGAGKSTLMLHLNGVLVPDSGTVTIHGVELRPDTVREIRRRVGVVFQDPDDQLFMPTVAQDVAFGPANFGVPDGELDVRVGEALAAVGMSALAGRAPGRLSVGERRRAALATVLSCRPDVLVLDEPSANLDPEARRELADVLRALDTTLLLVTHDLPYAARVCDRAVLLDAGRIVADRPIDELFTDDGLLARHRMS